MIWSSCYNAGCFHRGKTLIGFLNIPLMIPLGGLEELGWRYVLQANLQKNFLLESPP